MATDKDLIMQSWQTVKLLSAQLKVLKQSKNLFLAEMVMELMEHTSALELKLERLGRLSEKQGTS